MNNASFWTLGSNSKTIYRLVGNFIYERFHQATQTYSKETGKGGEKLQHHTV
jgi:hypothetical protein